MTKKKTKEDIQRWIDEHYPGALIVGDYVSANIKTEFRCKHGHTWLAAPHSITRGHSWCPRCSGRFKKTKDDIQKWIDKHHPGGKIVGDYVDTHTPVEIQCDVNPLHKWMTRPNAIMKSQRPTWCPYCAGLVKKTKLDMQKWIDKHHPGGKIVGIYVNTSTPVEIQCDKNSSHKWMARPNDIRKGSWCPYCSGRLGHSVDDLQEYIDKNHPGGIVVGKYIGETAKVEIQCEKGHKWMVTPSKVKGGRWCPYCSRRVKKTTDDIQEWIDEYHPGGKIIGDYVDTHTPVEIQCDKNPKHRWSATANSIVNRGQWCPYCVGKRHTRHELQEYIDEHHPGGEVIGEYVNHSTPVKIRCVCGNEWMVPPTNIMTRGSWCMKCSGKAKSDTKKLQQYIDENHPGGKVLDEYINALTKIRFQCAEGHIWRVKPGYVRHGQWCPVCAKIGARMKQSKKMEDLHRRYKALGNEELFRYTVAGIIDMAKCNGASRKTAVKLSVGARPPSINIHNRKESVNQFLEIVMKIAEELPELLDDNLERIVKNEIYRMEGY